MALTGLLLLVVLAGLVVLGVVVVVRCTGVLRWGSLALAMVSLVGGVAAGVNRHYGLYRSWDELFGLSSRDLVHIGAAGVQAAVAPLPAGSRRLGRGTLLQLQIPAPRAHLASRRAFVYLPPQYRDPAYALRSFPVVEGFQGSPGRPSDWINGLQLDRQMDRAIEHKWVAPAIVVLPDTNGGLARSLECTNTADGKADETFLVQDVRAFVTATFRTARTRWTGIGYSTGGYCALDLAVRHPDLYGRAVSLDGYAHALDDRYARGLWHSAMDRLQHSPDWWIAHRRPEPVEMYLLAGLDDRDAVQQTTSFWTDLARYRWRRPYDALVGQPDGHHTFYSWEAALAPSLSWALPGARPLPIASASLTQLRQALHRPLCGTRLRAPATTLERTIPGAGCHHQLDPRRSARRRVFAHRLVK